MKKALQQLLTAIRFLTILPLPWLTENDSEFFPESVKYFALVGLLIGAAGSAITLLLSNLLPYPLLCCVLLLYLSLISGFLHLDGIADTADGFFSSRPKEQILDIMRDSRTGAMGVIALLFLLLFKFVSILSLPSGTLFLAAFFLPLSGRCAIVLTMSFLPYAREHGGLGQMFYKEGKNSALLMSICTFIIAGFLIHLPLTLLIFFVLLTVIALFGMWCKRVIGGVTGDTLGAVCEVTETSVAIALSIFFNL